MGTYCKRGVEGNLSKSPTFKKIKSRILRKRRKKSDAKQDTMRDGRRAATKYHLTYQQESAIVKK